MFEDGCLFHFTYAKITKRIKMKLYSNKIYTSDNITISTTRSREVAVDSLVLRNSISVT